MTSTEPFAAIVMAAGQGTRMKSQVAKVLHPVCGLPMIDYPIRAALDAGASRVVVVVGHQASAVKDYVGARFGESVNFALQEQQLGTADAVSVGLAECKDAKRIVVLSGDVPAIESEAIRVLLKHDDALVLLTSNCDSPSGYGRIMRDQRGDIQGIVEDKDCTPEQRRIREINPAVYAFEVTFLKTHLSKVGNQNAQKELYLTDLVAIARRHDVRVATEQWPIDSLHGVNDRVDLAMAQRTLSQRIREHWMRQGVTMIDPLSTSIEAGVELEEDVVLHPNTKLSGKTYIGKGTTVDTGAVLHNTHVGRHAVLLPYTVATDSQIGDHARIGPFAHLRPGTALDAEVHIGNFVETKNTYMAAGAKASHLSYLGDGQIGPRVNIGAGTIFCNYDGVQKHTTVIKEGAFIGSDSQMVAPVTVGAGAYVASGTTLTRDVPDNALAIARAELKIKEGLAEKLRSKKRHGKS